MLPLFRNYQLNGTLFRRTIGTVGRVRPKPYRVRLGMGHGGGTLRFCRRLKVRGITRKSFRVNGKCCVGSCVVKLGVWPCLAGAG